LIHSVKARAASKAEGIEVDGTRNVLIIDVLIVPGDLRANTRARADADVNINLIYLTQDRQFVFGVDNLEKAKNVI